jgi:hypothetical protein
MEEAGESRGGRLGEGVMLTRCVTVMCLCPHPLLRYVPVRATRLRIGLHLERESTRRLSLTREGEGVGQ